MAPPADKSDGKQKLFSFRWLLRKSKSTKFPREVTTSVPTSKSCDAALPTMEGVERCQTYLLWKLLPPTVRQPNFCHRNLPFRSSFSCNDVHGLVPLTTNESVPSLNNILDSLEKAPSQSLYKWCKSHTALNRTASRDSLKCGQSSLCKLCLVTVPTRKMHSLENCGCTFCLICLQQYLLINIKEGNIPITCPDANCKSSGEISISEIKEIAGEEAMFMFERYKLNLDIILDPTRMFCPSPGCETICTFQPSSKPNVGVMVNCSKCQLKFCSLCKLRWHSKGTCSEARKALKEEIELSISEDENWIKRCPNCKVLIEKDDGCAQMMCYRCKHMFCWHCLASLDEDFLLRHYDKGPCRNKLGHSRASMIWHRTQVIGIFAGFSLFLLLAAPFLLLATPCLICCRCRSRFFYEEATPL